MIKFTTTNIVGTASQTTWSQVQSTSYTEDHQLVAVVELGCEEAASLIDLATVGAEILLEIEHKGQAAGSGKQLKTVVDEVIQGVAQRLTIEILVATLRGEKLALYGRGKVEAYLARGGQLARLKEDWGEGSEITGQLKDGDVVVFSTAKFSEAVGIDKLREILGRDEDPAELLAPLVHRQSDSSGVAGVVGVAQESHQTKAGSWWRAWRSRAPKIKLQLGSPRKVNLWIPGGVLILLLLMIGVGMVRRVKLSAEREFASLNTSVSTKIEETLSVGDLNPERARSLLSEAKGEVEAYLATDIREEYRVRGQKLIEEIDKADEQAFKKNEVQLRTIVELPILTEGLKSQGMKSDGKGNLIFLDTDGERVVLMNLGDRSRQVVDTGKAGKLVDVGVSEAHTYGLSTEGVSELSWKSNEVKKMIEPDEFWKNPSLIEMFAGNAYILDLEQSEIWKYPTLGETFGGRRRWLAPQIAPDLSKVVDMKVVGDIWLLTSSGKLERYSRGAPVSFTMEGLPAKDEAKKLSEPSAMWVSDSRVYVLENGASRVVVFDLEGRYEAQYVSAEFAGASDLVVVDNMAYVLVDNAVKEFGL